MRICVFSGTTEGHELSRFLAANGVPAEVFVATEYGAAVMEPMPGITVHEGRLDENEIAARLDADTLLIDATHPYAALVTDNLRTACAKTGARYERLLRPALRHGEGETVPDTEAAVAWLSRHPGKVLLTTGSKELEASTAVENFAERLYPRVLPEDGSWDREKPIGCSSARRRVQLAQLFPGIEVKPVRGNVQTRLRRLDSGEYGALVLAAAGLHRLGLENRISRYFSPEEMLPAAGQGILAVQAREGECRAAAQLLDDAETRVCALAERAFIRALGGGCFSPAAAYAVLENGMLRLRGLYVSADERSLIRGELTGAPETGERLGCMLAERLRRQAEEET